MVRTRVAITAVIAGFALALVAELAPAKMQSTKVDGVCLTKGGGRFVDIPGFPGEMIDRRLLRDVRMLKRRYKIFVTDGYSTSGVHAPNGEHPIGLALDIAPDKARGGTWADIDALAKWAEPRQNSPIAPFRWVGYDGDANHGRGHHLHLSWEHSPAKFGKPARSVYTVRCPKRRNPKPEGSKPPSEEEPTKAEKPSRPKPSGGTQPGKPPPPSGGIVSGTPAPGGASGGVGTRLAPVVVESGGVDG